MRKKNIVCCMCNSIVYGADPRTKYCPACRREHELRKSRNNYYKRKRMLVENTMPKQKISISEINARARASGMSYGRYVSMMQEKEVV